MQSLDLVSESRPRTLADLLLTSPPGCKGGSWVCALVPNSLNQGWTCGQTRLGGKLQPRGACALRRGASRGSACLPVARCQESAFGEETVVPWGSAPSLPTPLFEPGRRQLLPLDKANAGEEGQSGGGLESSRRGSNHPTSSIITKEGPFHLQASLSSSMKWEQRHSSCP